MGWFGFRDVFSETRRAGGAGCQTCRIADFQIGGARNVTVAAGVKARETADGEVCATSQGLLEWRQYPVASSRNHLKQCQNGLYTFSLMCEHPNLARRLALVRGEVWRGI
jgi:hypothetical protein